MLNKLHPTQEEVLEDYKAHQEKIKDLPHIRTAHLHEIQEFLDAHNEIKSQDEAKDVLTYLESLKDEWKEYYKVHPLELYAIIYIAIAQAHYVQGQFQLAIDSLQECLNVITNSANYRWLFLIKAGLHFNMARYYYAMNNIEQTLSNIKKGVYYELTKYNYISYNDFSFYGFRPIRDYVLEGIRDNKISLSDPCTFNDPIDPALLSHLTILINNENDDKEKEFLSLQRKVYESVRIACLCRAQPLPTEDENPEDIVKDPPFNEINKASMWGYYADSHKGICIKYVFPSAFTDHEHQKDNKVLILRNVNYNETYDPQSDSFNYTDAFFTKSKDWSHEGECRLVYFHTENKTPTYKWVNLPEHCIKEIYIGYAATNEDKRALLDIVKDKPEIKLFQMQLSSRNLFELEPVEIKRDIPSDKNGCCIGECIRTIKERLKK